MRVLSWNNQAVTEAEADKFWGATNIIGENGKMEVKKLDFGARGKGLGKTNTLGFFRPTPSGGNRDEASSFRKENDLGGQLNGVRWKTKGGFGKRYLENVGLMERAGGVVTNWRETEQKDHKDLT